MSLRALYRLACEGVGRGPEKNPPCPDAAVWPEPIADGDKLPAGWSAQRCPKCEAAQQAAVTDAPPPTVTAQ